MIFYNIESEKHQNWKWLKKKWLCLAEIKIAESKFTAKMQVWSIYLTFLLKCPTIITLVVKYITLKWKILGLYPFEMLNFWV